MPARDTIPPVELAPDRPTVGVPIRADFETMARDIAASAAKEAAETVMAQVVKPGSTGGRGGGVVDPWARAIGLVALLAVAGGWVAHELGNSRFERAVLGLIDVLSKDHPEHRDALQDVEREMLQAPPRTPK